ncbi:ER membrane protein complex subunit 2-like [Amphiura filiformis]|uniref:ER membrane protein complex subunit 2-like n=1 Tax=Amphiura filiformis TaxID=82378 RepID=UPI003B2288BE
MASFRSERNMPSVQEAKEKLSKWRDETARCSADIVELGEFLIDSHPNKLGDEAWLIYEQVCIAALDTGNIDLATHCIQCLSQQFPQSLRVKRLQGMRFEALARYDEAEIVYETILESDASNALARKRRVAIFKAQDRISDAIKELNKYLEKFMGDHEAWMELSDLYVSEQNYSKAAFCFEELIMSNPHNHLYHQKYAEIKYTQGGTEALEIARKYFAQAVKLNSNNIRALYGMFVASSHLASSSKTVNSKSKRENIKYAAWAAQQLAHKYKHAKAKETEGQMPYLEKMLDTLQITAGN